jgi:hypothetical protein
MSGWEVGDLALCLVEGEVDCSHCGLTHTGLASPAKGEVARVSALGPGIGSRNGCFALVLCFDGERLGLASRFRKIKPDTEPCEEEFTVLIKRGRKVSA